MKKISIIIPVYNVEKYIEECITSLLSQSYHNYEIIIVNDDTQDASIDKIRHLIDCNSNIKLVEKENGGLSSARNFGLKYATGEFITFVDSDDFIDKDFLKLMISAIGDADICSCGYKEGNEEGIVQCIIEYNSAPIGFCQFCILNAEYYEVPEKEYNRYIEKADLVFGIDIFIGEVSLRNQGLGTKSLRLLITALFNDYHADAILIDPKIHNARAIKCYHKCGFKDYFVVPHRELQDGIYHDSLIMGIRKE